MKTRVNGTKRNKKSIPQYPSTITPTQYIKKTVEQIERHTTLHIHRFPAVLIRVSAGYVVGILTSGTGIFIHGIVGTSKYNFSIHQSTLRERVCPSLFVARKLRV